MYGTVQTSSSVYIRYSAVQRQCVYICYCVVYQHCVCVYICGIVQTSGSWIYTVQCRPTAVCVYGTVQTISIVCVYTVQCKPTAG
jgi:hypothetical protein